jgi:ribosome-associated translation inhibitor RaiA
MNVDIRFRGLAASESLREHAMRQAHHHLSRFGNVLADVAVRLADVNGPKGGADKRCHVTVRGPRIASCAHEEISADPYSAVDLALEHVAARVGRDLDRARSTRSRTAFLVRRAS